MKEGKPVSVEFHNLIEDIVLRHVDNVMGVCGCCNCDQCKTDVVTYALNQLPPHYVATNFGRLMVELQSLERQSSTDIIAALSEGAERVAKNPRHSR